MEVTMSESESPYAKMHAEAVRRIRRLEQELRAALDGGSLLGIRNLIDREDGEPWFGVRVRGKVDAKLLFPGTRARGGANPKRQYVTDEDHEYLCLSPRGELVLTRCPAEIDQPVSDRIAPDEALKTEDLDHLRRTLAEVLARHVAAVSARERHGLGPIRTLLDDVMRQLIEEKPIEAERKPFEAERKPS